MTPDAMPWPSPLPQIEMDGQPPIWDRNPREFALLDKQRGPQALSGPRPRLMRQERLAQTERLTASTGETYTNS